jgi:outer membrane protein assembly factor BamB
MMKRQTLGLTAVLLAVAVGATGCAHGHNALHNPFAGKKHAKYAGTGERIPLIALNQDLSVADALKGQDFYLPPPQPNADWPLPGGNLAQAMEHVDAAPDFQVAWRSGFGRGSDRSWHVTATPVVADGRIYTMDGGATVSAFDAKTGREIWRRDLAVRTKRDKEAFGGGLAYADGKLFVTSGYRFAAAVDAATGAILWRTTVDEPIHAAPTVGGGRVYAETTGDDLLTFDTATGATGWSYQAITEPARILMAGSPAAEGDAVVAAFASGELVAVEADNGNGLWSVVLSKSNRNSALSEIRDIPGRPAIYKGDVYAVSHSGLFDAVDLRTGAERWSLPITSVSSAWPAGDVVYATDISGLIICASRENGQVYWITDLNKNVKKPKDRAIWSGPVLASNRIVVVSDKGEAVALDAKTGAVEKSLKIGQDALMSPIAAGGYLYVATQAGELVALR